MTLVSRVLRQWSDDWAYLTIMMVVLGMAAAACGMFALPVWILVDLFESDAFPNDSAVWGSAAWVASFILFGPRFVRLCSPVLENWVREREAK